MVSKRMVASVRGVDGRVRRGWRWGGFGVFLGLGDGFMEESDGRFGEWCVRG